MHGSSGPFLTSPERTGIVGPHGVYPLPRDLGWGPVWEGEPASNDSSLVLKFKLKLLLQLQHLWRTTAIISVSGQSEEMISQCPFVSASLKKACAKLLIVKISLLGINTSSNNPLKYRSHMNNSYKNILVSIIKFAIYSRCVSQSSTLLTKIMMWQ